MYSAKTKKVTTYGKRPHRYVAKSDDKYSAYPDASTEGGSLGAVGENLMLGNAKDVYSKQALSGMPITRSLKARQTSNLESNPKKLVKVNSRPPLGVYPTNVPNSPAIPPKNLKRYGIGKGIPNSLRLASTISPYVDVDITVLDDAGRRISQERRVSKTNVQVNSIGLDVQKSRKSPRRATRRPAAKRAFQETSVIIVTSDSDDDLDEDYMSPVKPTKSSNYANGKDTKVKDNCRKHQDLRSTEPNRDSLDSDPQTLRQPRLSRKTKRLTVTSDMESEDDFSLALHVATSSRLSEVSYRKKSTNSSGSQNITTIDLTRQTRPTIHDNSRSRKSQTKGIYSPRPHESSVEDRSSEAPFPSFSRARQLTPIRPMRFLLNDPTKRPAEIGTPSDSEVSTTLSIDEELEMALKVAELNLVDSPVTARSSSGSKSIHNVTSAFQSNGSSQDNDCLVASTSYITDLRALLSECGQITPFGFTDFIDSFPSDSTLLHLGTAGRSRSLCTFQKIGEASYSEVFGISNVVLKVVPLASDNIDEANLPSTSCPKDVLKEIIVTRAMGERCEGFIKLLKAYVVQGTYPSTLLSLWDAYNSRKGSEGIRPDSFSETQLYTIIILPNEGPDLEAFSFRTILPDSDSGWSQACSIFWQVARSLATAEELVHFEHRDLHWGQILIRCSARKLRSARSKTSSVLMDDPVHGVQATIIDLGLSRIDHGRSGTYWTPFSEDIFEGEGDYQYDIYRMMRKQNNDDWLPFRPLTNVMWLHYLADKLLHHKRLRPPTSAPSVRPSRKSVVTTATRSSFSTHDKEAYDCLKEVESTLESVLLPISCDAMKKKNRRKGAKTQLLSELDPSIELRSAMDILRLGIDKGWIA